jgi:hypothetical protein
MLYRHQASMARWLDGSMPSSITPRWLNACSMLGAQMAVGYSGSHQDRPTCQSAANGHFVPTQTPIAKSLCGATCLYPHTVSVSAIQLLAKYPYPHTATNQSIRIRIQRKPQYPESIQVSMRLPGTNLFTPLM